MFQAKSAVCIFLFLIFVALPHVVLSTRVNKTTADGKIFITGDHNEVVVSMSKEAKITLAEIKTKLQSLSKKDEELTRKLQVLDERILSQGTLDAMNETAKNCSKRIELLDGKLEKKQDLVNKSNSKLSLQIQVMSYKLQKNLDKQGKLDAMNETINALSKMVKSVDERTEKKLDLLKKSNTAISLQIQMLSQRLATLENRATAGYALHFPRKGTSDYVITRGMPSLKAVTVCLWMKTANTGNEGTPLSYNKRGSDNELLLLDYRNFYFWVGSAHSGRTSVSANDGKWHHICATWENTAGSWKLYKDGKVAASGKGLKTGYVIPGGGALVLGQEQDSEGGSFNANQSFIGEMTGVNIWDHVIKDQEIIRMTMTMSSSCLAGVGNVFKWSDFKAHLKGSVKIIKPSC